jgi:ribosomal-protein-alanine N-acetyltransferase
MLRRALQSDVDVLAAIHAAAFPPAEAWSCDVFGLQLAMPNVFTLLHQPGLHESGLHESGGLIMVRVAADEAEILTLAVVPTMRRGGIGLALLRQATGLAATFGARTVFLEVSVINVAARALYTKVGFARAGLRRHYYSDRSDALVLRLDLDPPA